MRRKLLATLALIGALTASVLFGTAAPAGYTLAGGSADNPHGPHVVVGANRGW